MSEYPEMMTPAEWQTRRQRHQTLTEKRRRRAAQRAANRANNPRPSILRLEQRLAGKQFTATTDGYVEQSDKQGTGVPLDQL